MYAVEQYHPRKRSWKIVLDTIKPDKKTVLDMAKTLNSMVEKDILKTVSVKEMYRIIKLRSKDLPISRY